MVNRAEVKVTAPDSSSRAAQNLWLRLLRCGTQPCISGGGNETQPRPTRFALSCVTRGLPQPWPRDPPDQMSWKLVVIEFLPIFLSCPKGTSIGVVQKCEVRV